MDISNRWSRLLARIVGAGVAALGLAVVLGWHTRTRTILQPTPGLIAPVYNTALSFLLCGGGLLAIVSRRFALALGCGAVASVLGGLNLIEHLSGVNLGIDQLLVEHFITTATTHPGRMAPNTAVCFVLAGAAIGLEGLPALARRRPPFVGLLGSVVASLGVVAASGYLLGVKTYGWGTLLPMAPQTAAGFVALGAGVLAVAWGEADGLTGGDFAPSWLPIPVGVAAQAATLCLWTPLVAQGHAQVDRTSRAELAAVSRAITDSLETRCVPLRLMAGRGEGPAACRRDAERLVAHFADFEAIDWVDPAQPAHRVAPRPTDAAPRERTTMTQQLGLVAKARLDRDLRIMETDDGDGKGAPLLLVAVPVATTGAGEDQSRRQDVAEGAFLAVVRIRDLLAACLAGDVAPGSAIVVSGVGGELFARNADDRRLADEWGSQGVVAHRGLSWHLRVWPGPGQLDRSLYATPAAVMVIGSLIAVLLAWAVRLTQVAHGRASALAAANRRLGGEIDEHAKAERSLRQTGETLGQTLEAIGSAVAVLATTSTELLESVSLQSAGLQEQVIAVAETVTTVEQVARASEQAAAAARSVGDAIRVTLKIGGEARRAVDDSSAALKRVQDQAGSTAADMQTLAEAAEDIAAIIATVDEIAEQTNVLALNAAIEASRAGATGAGFAVVAREVKALAGQCKLATVQVRRSLGEIRKATETSVRSTGLVTRGVADAMRTEGQTAGAINALAETLADTAEATARIVASANQQAIGMAQVSQAMKSLEQVERQNDAALRQLKQMAQNLHTLSNRLAGLDKPS